MTYLLLDGNDFCYRCKVLSFLILSGIINVVFRSDLKILKNFVNKPNHKQPQTETYKVSLPLLPHISATYDSPPTAELFLFQGCRSDVLLVVSSLDG